MGKIEEKEIIEYRCHNNEDCMLVRWSDGIESWEKATNLSNKSLVCGFVWSCLEILRKKQKEESEAKQREMEEALLQKIISSKNNLPPSAKDQEAIKHSIIDDVVKRNTRGPRPEAFVGMKRYPKASERTLSAIAELKREEPLVKKFFSNKKTPQVARTFRPSHQENICNFRYKGSIAAYIKFFIDMEMKDMLQEVEEVFFVPLEEIYTFLFFFSRHRSKELEIYPATFEIPGNSQDLKVLEKELRENNIVMLFKNNGIDYILYLSKTTPFSFSGSSKAFLIKIEDPKYLSTIYENMELQKEVLVWDDGTFRSSVITESNCMFGKHPIPAERTVYFLNDGAAQARHAINILSASINLSEKLTDNCDIVIQGSLYDFIHQIPRVDKFYQSGRKIYGLLPGFMITEIQKKAYMFGVTEGFAQKCNMNLFYEFATNVFSKSHCSIVLNNVAYNILLKRSKMIPTKEVAVAWVALIEKLQKYVQSGVSSRFCKEIRRKFGILFRKIVFLDDSKQGSTLQDAILMV